MAALVLLPPLPPEPEPVVVRGQQCFGFIEIVVVVREVRPRRRPGARSVSEKEITSGQLAIPERQEPKGRRRRAPTKLRLWEREQMEEDIAVLEKAGVFDERPRMAGGKADCPTGPCPWVACRENLFVTIRPSGKAVKYNFPGKDIDEVGETCALRVAKKTELSGEPLPFRKLAKYTNETYARAEQINGQAMRKFVEAWARMFPDDPPPRFGKE